MDKRKIKQAAEVLKQSAEMLETILKLRSATEDDRKELLNFINEQRTLAAELEQYYKQIWNARDELIMRTHNKGDKEAQEHVKNIQCDPNKKPWL